MKFYKILKEEKRIIITEEMYFRLENKKINK